MEGVVFDFSPPAGHAIVTYTLTGDQVGAIAAILVAAIVALAFIAVVREGQTNDVAK